MREIIMAWSVVWEGSLQIRKNKIRCSTRYKDYNYICYSPAVYVVNTNLSLLEKFKDIVGYGTIQTVSHREGNRRTIFRWCVQSKALVKRFCEEILPYLPAKVEQAKILIEFCSLPVKHRLPGRDLFYWRMKELNRRGVN